MALRSSDSPKGHSVFSLTFYIIKQPTVHLGYKKRESTKTAQRSSFHSVGKNAFTKGDLMMCFSRHRVSLKEGTVWWKQTQKQTRRWSDAEGCGGDRVDGASQVQLHAGTRAGSVCRTVAKLGRATGGRRRGKGVRLFSLGCGSRRTKGGAVPLVGFCCFFCLVGQNPPPL